MPLVSLSEIAPWPQSNTDFADFAERFARAGETVPPSERFSADPLNLSLIAALEQLPNLLLELVHS